MPKLIRDFDFFFFDIEIIRFLVKFFFIIFGIFP